MEETLLQAEERAAMQTELRRIVEELFTLNSQIKEMQEDAEACKEIILGLMANLDEEKLDVGGGFSVTIVTTNKTSFNDDFLLWHLKEKGLLDLIKIKEMVDMEGLQQAVKDGKFPAKLVVEARTIKSSSYPRVSNKGAKNDA